MYNLFYIECYATVVSFPALMACMEFFYSLSTGKRLWRWGAPLLEIVVLVLPPFLLYMVDAPDYQTRSSIIYPNARLIVYTLILLCLTVYFYATWRKRLASPLWEIFINCSLLLGVMVNILLMIRVQDLLACICINLPAALLLILALVRSHRLLMRTLEDTYVDVLEPAPRGWFSRACWYLLKMRPLAKTLVLITLSLPACALLMKVMLLSAGDPIH